MSIDTTFLRQAASIRWNARLDELTRSAILASSDCAMISTTCRPAVIKEFEIVLDAVVGQAAKEAVSLPSLPENPAQADRNEPSRIILPACRPSTGLQSDPDSLRSEWLRDIATIATTPRTTYGEGFAETTSSRVVAGLPIVDARGACRRQLHKRTRIRWLQRLTSFALRHLREELKDVAARSTCRMASKVWAYRQPRELA